MTKLDRLIAELCPGGVEYRALGEVCLSTPNINWKQATGAEYRYIDLTSVDRETHKISDTTVITTDTAPSRARTTIE